MDNNYIFNFKADIADINIPSKLNNPFGTYIPEIASMAAKEFQEFIAIASKEWNHDYYTQKGKMFGILVVQKKDNNYCYLGTVSGKLYHRVDCDRFVPSMFDESVGDFFINKGMTELTEIGTQIKNTNDPAEIILLKEKRRKKSNGLQKRLFENYNFLNLSGKKKNLIEIFEESSHGNPPAAAGECAAPKLLQFAIQHHLKPIALAEFWLGKPIKDKGKTHKAFYPACRDRCRPILEYMLEDERLFEHAKI